MKNLNLKSWKLVLTNFEQEKLSQIRFELLPPATPKATSLDCVVAGNNIYFQQMSLVITIKKEKDWILQDSIV